MKKFILKEIAGPVVRRIGTMLGAYMIASGVADETANVIVAGVIAAIGLAVDLVASHLSRGR